MRNNLINRYRTFGIGFAFSAFSLGFLYFLLKLPKRAALPASAKDDKDKVDSADSKGSKASKSTKSTKSVSSSSAPKSDDGVPSTPAPTKDDPSAPLKDRATVEETHKKVEEIDRRGKALFKSKQYLEAATCFTEALDVLRASNLPGDQTIRQEITVINNRSAMYEKGGLEELALDDCDVILEKDCGHMKARVRRLRILEGKERWREALVEVCALQLRYMQDNRDKLRMGLPLPPPPTPQDKIETLVGLIIPEEIEAAMSLIKANPNTKKVPSNHTVLQLLQSFSGYNSWMAEAARGPTVAALTASLELVKSSSPPEAGDDDQEDSTALLTFQRGRRHAYDGKFDLCVRDMETAHALVVSEKCKLLPDDYIKLLGWVGMSKHLQYELPEARKCYQECCDLDPDNAETLVKLAGVEMDSNNYPEATKLFSKALTIDPTATDALLHRANLHMLLKQVPSAKTDLERCLQLNPGHFLARLRLATVCMSLNELDGANKHLDEAEKLDSDSAEVTSYRGEMSFSQGQFADAQAQFAKAILRDPLNPTPYVNAALVAMNTPLGDTGRPDVAKAFDMLNKAIEVDPQYQQAYIQLGQLKLSLAQNLEEAREVLKLYNTALEFCRVKEELRDICNMRILTVAQVDAAEKMGMVTLNMQ